MGFVGIFLLYGFISFEQGFDDFQVHKENIHRVDFKIFKNGKLEVNSATSTPLISPLLYHEMAGIRDFTRLYPRSGNVISSMEDQQKLSFPTDEIYHADSSFFRMFSFHLADGNVADMLKKPFTAVISEKLSHKLFGKQNPIGKSVYLSDDEAYVVEGVFADIPDNSHLYFEALFSMSTLEKLAWSAEDIRSSWGWYSFYSYVLFEEDRDLTNVNNEILRITKSHTAELDKRINGSLTFELTPFTDIYLNSNLSGEMARQGNSSTIQTMLIVALAIAMIALINYFNILTSVHLQSIRNEGMRKVLGNKNQQFMAQYTAESFIHLTIALFMAMGICFLSWSYFMNEIGKSIPIHLLFETENIVGLLAIILLISLSMGLYQSGIINSFHLTSIIKGSFQHANSGIGMRKIILGIQFIATTALIIGSITFIRQLDFMQGHELGFEPSNNISITVRRSQLNNAFYERLQTFVELASSNSDILSGTTSGYVPGDEVGWTNGAKLPNQETTIKFHHYPVDENFLTQFDIALVAGRNLGKISGEARQILVNEKGLELLGISSAKDILSQQFLYGGDADNSFEIIGVVKNYYQRGLKHADEPIAFHYLPNNATYNGPINASFKLAEGHNPKVALDELKAAWETIYGGQEMEYKYLDDYYNSHYASDEQSTFTILFVSLLAIVLSILGLIGLLSFSALQKTKEIGIRKVLGSSIVKIQLILGKEYLLIASIAVLVGLPMVYLLLEKWLSNFVNSITLGFDIFAYGGLSVLLLTIVTIAIQSYKYAIINPVDAIGKS
jgi:putative ABC transport system permease protein